MPELLEHVPPPVQPQVLEHVFAGKYRADDDGPGLGDPQVELHTLIHRCREEALDHRVRRWQPRRQRSSRLLAIQPFPSAPLLLDAHAAFSPPSLFKSEPERLRLRLRAMHRVLLSGAHLPLSAADEKA